jgi:two-component system chemotaxis sensor kinase CheA
MSVDLEQFHQVFFEESFEGLDVMESGLMALDLGSANNEDINTIFRAAHSIKGGSGTFGFKNISDFTHVMETLLDEMRDGRRHVTREAVDVLLHSVDVLRMLLNSARDKTDPDQHVIREQLVELETLLGSSASNTGPAAKVAAAPVAQGSGWHITFVPHPNMMQTGNDPLRIVRELAAMGEARVTTFTDKLPRLDEINPENSYLGWEIELKGDITEDQLKEVFLWVEDECDLTIKSLAAAAPVVAKPAGGAVNAGAQEKSAATEKTDFDKSAAKSVAADPAASSIRVDIGKIDALINMVGELVITQSMLSLLGEDFTLERLNKLQEGLTHLERHTRELQESVMMIRMLPISFSFSRFPRLVRDLSAKMGKKIDLIMSGENTEIDKTLIEKIGDPLVHLVRNSIDHGIELPADRIKAGKKDTGTIRLNAYHKGGNIVIEIKDDGKGIDTNAVLRKAIEKGLVKEGANLNQQQIFDLIFQPGFSTAAVVTDVSGRGVGMDVVRKNIASLGGAVDIQSEMGVGSTFSIRLPLTLAILDGQTVLVGEENYIVPLVNIVESIQAKPHMVNRVAGKGETFKLRDEYIPIVRLGRVFNIESARDRKLEEGLLVVVEADGRRCGLFVDDLLGQQQVVIKSLEQNYRRVDGVSGATILGDGSVALILDAPGLLRMSVRH